MSHGSMSLAQAQELKVRVPNATTLKALKGKPMVEEFSSTEGMFESILKTPSLKHVYLEHNVKE